MRVGLAVFLVAISFDHHALAASAINDFKIVNDGSEPLALAPGATTQRNPAAALPDISSAAALGVDISGSTDPAVAAANTAALTAACSGTRRRIFIPPGTVRINDVIACTTPGVEFVGSGPGSTEIIQTNGTKGVFVLDEANGIGGGISDLSIAGVAPHFNSPGSSGIAIDVRHCNEGFAVRRVHIRNMDVGIQRTKCFSDRYTDIDIRYFRNVAIWTPMVTSGDPSNDGRFTNVKIQNINFVQADGATPIVPDAPTSTGSNARQIGMLWQQSGGDQVTAADIIAVGAAVVIQPPAGHYLAYLRFTDVLADGSYYGNVVVDATAGSISRVVMTNLWAAYSINGSGLLVLGAKLDGLRLTGGDARERSARDRPAGRPQHNARRR